MNLTFPFNARSNFATPRSTGGKFSFHIINTLFFSKKVFFLK